MKFLIKVIMLAILLIIPSITSATRDLRGYGYPEVEVKNNCFYIYYVDIPYSREFVSVVSNKGYLKELQHEAEVEHKHFKKITHFDLKLGDKYNLACARMDIEKEDKLYFQGMTSDCELKIFITNKDSGQVIASKDLGPTTVSEHPFSSEIVLADNHIFLAYWSLIGWINDYSYNLVICDWDFVKDTIHVYPIAHIKRNYHTTLSMAMNKGILGLAYFECDDSNTLNKYNRIRFALIDSRDLSIIKSLWISR